MSVLKNVSKRVRWARPLTMWAALGGLAGCAHTTRAPALQKAAPVEVKPAPEPASLPRAEAPVGYTVAPGPAGQTWLLEESAGHARVVQVHVGHEADAVRRLGPALPGARVWVLGAPAGPAVRALNIAVADRPRATFAPRRARERVPPGIATLHMRDTDATLTVTLPTAAAPERAAQHVWAAHVARSLDRRLRVERGLAAHVEGALGQQWDCGAPGGRAIQARAQRGWTPRAPWVARFTVRGMRGKPAFILAHVADVLRNPGPVDEVGVQAAHGRLARAADPVVDAAERALGLPATAADVRAALVNPVAPAAIAVTAWQYAGVPARVAKALASVPVRPAVYIGQPGADAARVDAAAIRGRPMWRAAPTTCVSAP